MQRQPTWFIIFNYCVIQHTAYSIQHTAYSIQHTAYRKHTIYTCHKFNIFTWFNSSDLFACKLSMLNSAAILDKKISIFCRHIVYLVSCRYVIGLVNFFDLKIITRNKTLLFYRTHIQRCGYFNVNGAHL